MREHLRAAQLLEPIADGGIVGRSGRLGLARLAELVRPAVFVFTQRKLGLAAAYAHAERLRIVEDQEPRLEERRRILLGLVDVRVVGAHHGAFVDAQI